MAPKHDMARLHNRDAADNHFGMSIGAIIGIYGAAIPVGLGLLVFILWKISRRMGWIKRSPMAILHLQGGVGARPPTTPIPTRTRQPAGTTANDDIASQQGRDLSIAEELKDLSSSGHDLKP